jgi:formylglycine-generating enzyme required for sulfatase activity
LQVAAVQTGAIQVAAIPVDAAQKTEGGKAVAATSVARPNLSPLQPHKSGEFSNSEGVSNHTRRRYSLFAAAAFLFFAILLYAFWRSGSADMEDRTGMTDRADMAGIASLDSSLAKDDLPLSLRLLPREITLEPPAELDLTKISTEAVYGNGKSAKISATWSADRGRINEGRFIAPEGTGECKLVATFQQKDNILAAILRVKLAPIPEASIPSLSTASSLSANPFPVGGTIETPIGQTAVRPPEFQPFVKNPTVEKPVTPHPDDSAASHVVKPLSSTEATIGSASISKNKTIAVDLGEGREMEFVLIEPGEFVMGGPEKESSPPHKTLISKGYWLAKTEVTNAQWEAVMISRMAHFPSSEAYPVQDVAFDDVLAFIRKADRTGIALFRLPTEAEWEFACRGGTNSDYYWGENIDDRYCWSEENSNNSVHPVAKKLPNGCGLYDMSGNVSEWCSDWYDMFYYGKNVSCDPAGPSAGQAHSKRGGSYATRASACKSSSRNNFISLFGQEDVGFRLVLVEKHSR